MNKTKELVVAGHALAKELHCPESAALVRELATQLDVQRARADALAAENIKLKTYEPEPFGPRMMCVLDKFESGNEDVPELAMINAYRNIRGLIETPVTDAILAEVRASGVEMFAAYCGEENSVFVETKAYYRSLPDAAYEFAAQLRQEAK